MSEVKGLCHNCHLHTASILWAPHGDMDIIHGTGIPWCACCVLKERIKVISELADKLPALKAELAAVSCSSPHSDTSD